MAAVFVDPLHKPSFGFLQLWLRAFVIALHCWRRHGNGGEGEPAIQGAARRLYFGRVAVLKEALPYEETRRTTVSVQACGEYNIEWTAVASVETVVMPHRR